MLQMHYVHGHQFTAQQYYTVTTCSECQGVLWGIGSQGYQCASEYPTLSLHLHLCHPNRLGPCQCHFPLNLPQPQMVKLNLPQPQMDKLNLPSPRWTNSTYHSPRWTNSTHPSPRWTNSTYPSPRWTNIHR